MGFRLAVDKPLARSVRRIATDELTHAISLLNEQPEGMEHAIHKARRALKKTRGLYRLIAPGAPFFQREENARLRDIARSLSATRDSAVLVSTVTRLEAADGAEVSAAIAHAGAALEARHAARTASANALDLAATIAALKQAREAADRFVMTTAGRPPALLAKAWRKSILKAQDALKRCHEAPEAEAFHDLRKRAQDWRFFHLLMREAWPGPLNARETRLKALSEDLGMVNDFAVLHQLIEREVQLLSGHDRALVLAAIAETLRKRRKKVLAKADALYEIDAATDARHLKHLWRKAG
ncbi:hypothetical protein BJF93_02670 [Xaviernesmea oryzae]|uniref:CHAD domain-containing protein n=1 Tax=Xaviernesmea oryzae TaxID=464029 RepID=A0A1Q9AZ59_9HYPH|nr:CHAD domain-containing protein [Xaviernesmea oryzae]OLP60988.1 hypothetical protein BJF93_02670 [Xaviernesmea oryzae]SEL18674.1 CHAD domain-containing protein [Xaviernesmea oryzae]